ncbi:hypothetical protein BDF14DRAFT_1751142 [Spinellus fusiger]|nr:hypothetical protein BDF14DRAFT_1751142 [Spinellus fusiger]
MLTVIRLKLLGSISPGSLTIPPTHGGCTTCSVLFITYIRETFSYIRIRCKTAITIIFSSRHCLLHLDKCYQTKSLFFRAYKIDHQHLYFVEQ